ncbi:MAG: MMPL family transporter, partial [Motiliproteus sp.]
MRWAAYSWFGLVIAVVFLAFRQHHIIDSSILTLLPKSEQQAFVQQAADSMSAQFSNRLIMLLSGESDEKVRSAVTPLAQELSESADISEVLFQIEEKGIGRLRDDLYPYRFSILGEETRKLMLAGEYSQVRDRALVRLLSPLSPTGSHVVDDPFSLFDELLSSRNDELNVQVSDSFLKVTGTNFPTYMLMVTLSGDPFSPDLQGRVLGTISRHEQVLKESGVSIQTSGMLMHAAAGATQASREMSTIGIGSLAGIVLVMLMVFRQFSSLLLILVPVAVGCSVAAAVSILVFDRVHIVTFAFGAGLVGVSIDYALHFLCERRATASKNVLKKILPGLLLGLLSSVFAYAAQALTPFPGLRQMAVFSVVGLCASWLTVVLWFPYLTSKQHQSRPSVVSYLNKVRNIFPRLEGNPILIILVVVTLCVAINALRGGSNQDDVRLLQTSPPELLTQEKNVQKLLGMNGSSQFFLVLAGSLDQCLEREERLVEELNRLKSLGHIRGYQSLSTVLPSLSRQVENIELVEQVYSSQLPSFYSTLGLPDAMLSKAADHLDQTKFQPLTAEVWLQQKGNDSWKNLIVEQSEEQVATIIQLKGDLDDDALQQLELLSDPDHGL